MTNNNGRQKKKNNKQDEKRVVQSRRVRNGDINNKYFLPKCTFTIYFNPQINSIIMEKKNGLSTVNYEYSRVLKGYLVVLL